MLQDLNHLGKRVASELNTFAEKTTSRKRERDDKLLRISLEEGCEAIECCEKQDTLQRESDCGEKLG